MNKVSSYAATAQSDIADSPALFEKQFLGYSMFLYNTGDSVWIVIQYPNNTKMAFRAAFALNSKFTVSDIKENNEAVIIELSTGLGNYIVEINLPDNQSPVLHYTTRFKTKTPILIPYSPRDIIPLTKNGQTVNTRGTIHVSQAGTRTGLLFASMASPGTGSFFYMQNLTALSEFCDVTKTSLSGTVGGEWPEMGFQLPAATEIPLPNDKFYTLSDAYILFSHDSPIDAIDISTQYLNNLSILYSILPKPDTNYQDWQQISRKALRDLTINKGCWSYAGGHAYLNAYLCDYKTPPEIMVQLAVLNAITEHAKWTGTEYDVIKEIAAGVPAFFDEKLKTISRWLPSQRGELDESEEQKSAMVMDSWYLHHPLMNLSKLALNGDKDAKELLLKSLDYAIKVARHFDYKWPVFYKMDTLEIVKKETAAGKGGEKDVAGGYAHLMINVWKLTGEKKYLNEAIKAAKNLAEMGNEIFYQANNTAFSALAMLRLYKETKDVQFLETSYLCIAGIMKNVQLWECNYGNAKEFDNFFGVFPLNDAPYKAAYEEMEVYAALNDYIKEAFEMNAPILSSLYILLPEFVKYSVSRLPYYYPTLLPEDILSKDVKTGEVDNKLWIPIEDLYDGWEQHGQVGQEVYGAGVGFGVVPRQYIKIDQEDFIIYTDYPVHQKLNLKDKKLTLQFIGNDAFQCRLLIINPDNNKKKVPAISLTDNNKDVTIKPVKTSKEQIEFSVKGNAEVKIKW